MTQLEPVDATNGTPTPAVEPAAADSDKSVLSDDITGKVSPVLEHIKAVVDGKAEPAPETKPELEPIPPDTSGLSGKEKQLADLQSMNTKLWEENRRLKAMSRVERLLDHVEAAAGIKPDAVPPNPPNGSERPPETSFMTQKEFDDLEREKGFLAAQAEYMRRYEAARAKISEIKAETERIERDRNENIAYMQQKYPSYQNDSAGFAEYLLKKVVRDMQIYGSTINNDTVNNAVKRYAADRSLLESNYHEYLASIGAELPQTALGDDPISREKLASVPIRGTDSGRAQYVLNKKPPPEADGYMTFLDKIEEAMPGRRVGMF